MKFRIGFNEINKENIAELWKKQEAYIQSVLDENSKLKLPIKDFDIKNLNKELDITKKKLSDIISLQGGTVTRTTTPLQTSKINILEQKAAIDLSSRQAINLDKVAISHERLSQATLRTEKMQRALLNSTNSQNKAFRTQAGILNGLPQYLNAYVSLLGGTRLVSNIKDITAEYERQKVSLAALTQDAEFANQLFENIKQNAIASPFSASDLINYTKQLAAYNVENKDLYGTMNMLADVSAGLGVDMSRLILAYGQVGAASVLRGQELRQFTEAGIPLVQLLANKFTALNGTLTTTGDLFELISKRAVPFEMIKEIFTDMTSKGGKFFEMQKIQAESLWGIYENLTDNIEQGFDKIGRSNRGVLVGVGKGATVLAQNLDEVLSSLTLAGTGFAVLKLAIMVNNAMMGENNAELIKNIIANKAKEATLLKQASIYRELDAEEKIKLATSGKITTANLLELATSGGLTKDMVLRLVATRKLTSIQAMRLSTTLNITKAEIAQAAATTLAGRAYLAFGGAIRMVGLALKSLLTNPVTWIFVAIAGIMKWTMAISEHSKKVKEDYENSKKSLREYSEQVAKSYNDVKGVIEKGLTFKVDTTEVFEAINTLKGLVGENKGLYSLLMQGTGGENSMVQDLALMVANWEAINDGVKNANNSLFAFSDAVNAIGGRWFAFSFNEKLETNIKDIEGGINDVRRSLIDLSKENMWDAGVGDYFREFTKEAHDFDEIIKFSNEALDKTYKAHIEGGLGKADYSDLNRQLRGLISDSETAKEQFSKLDKYISSQFKGVDWSKATIAQKAELQAMKDAFDKTNTDMSESGRKIWDAYFAKHYYLNFSLVNISDIKELSAEQKDFNRFLDSINSNSLRIKNPAKDMSKQAQETYDAYEDALAKIGVLQRKFAAGNKTVTKETIEEQKKLSAGLLKEAKYLGYKEQNRKDGGEKDYRIKLWKEEINAIKEASIEYDKYVKLQSKEKAKKSVESGEKYKTLKPILEKQGIKLNITSEASIKEALNKIYLSIPNSKEYKDVRGMIEKIFDDIDFKDIENNFNNLLKDLAFKIETEKNNINLYNSLIDKGASKEVAIDIVFNSTGETPNIAHVMQEQISKALNLQDLSLDLSIDPKEIEKWITEQGLALNSQTKNMINEYIKYINSRKEDVYTSLIGLIKTPIPTGEEISFDLSKVIIKATNDLYDLKQIIEETITEEDRIKSSLENAPSDSDNYKKLKIEYDKIIKYRIDGQKQLAKIESASNIQVLKDIGKLGNEYIKAKMNIVGLGDDFSNMSQASVISINKIQEVLNGLIASLLNISDGENGGMLLQLFTTVGLEDKFDELKGVFSTLFEVPNIETFNKKIIDIEANLSEIGNDKVKTKLLQIITLLRNFGIALENTSENAKKIKLDAFIDELNGLKQSIDSVINGVQSIFETFDIGIDSVAGKSLELIKTLSTSVLEVITQTAKLSVKGIKSVEKASVILAIIGVALQVMNVIFNMFDKSKKLEKEIEDLQSEIDFLSEMYNKLNIETFYDPRVLNQLKEELEIRQKLLDYTIKTAAIEAGVSKEGRNESLQSGGLDSLTMGTIGSLKIAGKVIKGDFKSIGESALNMVTLGVFGLVKAIGQAKARRKNLELIRKANKEQEYQNKLLEIANSDMTAMQKTGESQMANLEEQNRKLIQQRDAEMAKGKKMDTDKVLEYNKKIAENEVKIQYAYLDILNKNIGDVFKDLADGISDALLSAWESGEDGAKAFDESVDKMMRNVIKNLFKMNILPSLLQPFMEKFYLSMGLNKDGSVIKGQVPDLAIDASESKELAIEKAKAKEDILKAWSSLSDTLSDWETGNNTETGLTGIAKNVAQASEDDITGLASGINTQNSYFAKTVTNTNNILFLMQKWDSERGISKTSNTDMTLQKMYDLQLPYLKELPQISTNTKNTSDGIASINEKLDSIIMPNKVRGSKAINVNI
ncbi:MAG: tape measure protein [Muribaculaceae bacterium]